MAAFSGFVPDTYKFLMELGFNNDRAFFDANRARCRAVVQEPMRALATELIPTALELDSDFNTRLTSAVSRMNRDTRFSKNKLPYRDHAWIGFKHSDVRVSESFSIYFEIETDGYGYGAGTYGANSEVMAAFRARALADCSRFLDIMSAPALSRFTLEGEMYKRDHFPDAPEALKPYLNRKGIGLSFFSPELRRTMDAALADEIKEAFLALKPFYRFIAGLE